MLNVIYAALDWLSWVLNYNRPKDKPEPLELQWGYRNVQITNPRGGEDESL